MKPIIQLKQASFTIKHPLRSILTDINLQIAPGEFVIILGSNGSGKSSLLKLLDRRYECTSGKVLVEEKPIESYAAAAFAKQLITLTQNPLDSLFSSLTVEENCLLSLQKSNKELQNKKNLKVYLNDFNPNLADNLNSLVSSLSGGEQQSLTLALACLASPKILLLDEHTSALDPLAADRLMAITAQMIKRLGITCLLTTHNLDIATQYGSRIIALQNGQMMRDYDNNEKQKLTADGLRKFCY